MLDQELHRVIANRYRLVSELGQGSFGKTYLAEDDGSATTVVLKLLRFGVASDWKAVELFERECRLLAELTHPSIPRYLDHFALDQEGRPTLCLVQERAAGKSLAALVQEGWHADEETIIDIAAQALEVLAYLHGREPALIHRDIKPQNLILAEDGHLSVVDFGSVAMLVQNGDPGAETVVGTFSYMAPEQGRGRAVPASDLYSLGCTLLYILSHRQPDQFPMDGLRIAFQPHVRCSPALADWLARMIEPTLEERFASAESALAALRDREAHWRERKRARRRRLQIGLLAGAGLALGMAGAVMAIASRAAPPALPSIPPLVAPPLPAPISPEPHAPSASAPMSEPPALPVPSVCESERCSLWMDELLLQTDRGEAIMLPLDMPGLTIELWVKLWRGGSALVQWSDVTVFADERSLGGRLDDKMQARHTWAADGLWHHVAFTYDGRTARLLTDGQLAASYDCERLRCRLPRFRDLDWIVLRGQRAALDEVRVWSVAKAPDELAIARNHPLTGKEAHLAGYWDFNHPDAETAIDRTGRHAPRRFVVYQEGKGHEDKKRMDRFGPLWSTDSPFE